MENFIFVIGPAWKNLNTLLETIRINKKMLPNIKKIYIPTNDKNVETYFIENPHDNIVCKFCFENKNHSLSCFNGVVSAMHMVLENEKNNDDNIVIFAHEDCYIKNMDLFNNALKKITDEKYEIVCREFDAPISKNHYEKYYMFDTFYIKQSVIAKYFTNEKILDEFYDFGEKPKNHLQFHAKNKKFCEAHFTRIIQKANIYSILYSKTRNRYISTPDGDMLAHGTWGNTELGFYHIPGRM
jgi:hypothetical protein